MSEKKEQKPLTIHGKMAQIKKELGETKIAKSGHNKFAGFKYHELSDFIAVINNLNLKHGVNDVVEIDEANSECRLTLVNVDSLEDKIVVRTPFREAEMLGKGGAPSNVDAIQRMGSTITYNRRYLYMTAYNIQENDGVDVQEPVEKKPTPTPQAKPALTPKPKAPAKPKAREDGMLVIPTKADIDACIHHKLTIEEVVCIYKLNDEQCEKYVKLLNSKK